MKQVVLKKGAIHLAEVPAPVAHPGYVLIDTAYSCISPGTEMANIMEGKKSLLSKAASQPDKAVKALKIAISEGPMRLYNKISGKLNELRATGYSISGTVADGLTDGSNFTVGQRVAAAGAGYANHAEFALVPLNLTAAIPDGVSMKDASTTTLGAIALQGVRRAKIALGEYVAVFGTGAIGLLATRLAVLSGARVLAIDLDDRRLEIASEFGATTCNPSRQSLTGEIEKFTGGHLADACLFCASSGNPETLSSAFSLLRHKGRMIMVGVYGKEIRREDLYAKELDFLISTSYGPGRYDVRYEEHGIDYPYAYVRWTEKRNMEEYLRLLADKKIDLSRLTETVLPLREAAEAYAKFDSPAPPVIVLLEYEREKARESAPPPLARPRRQGPVGTALVGPGNYAGAFHLPNLKKLSNLFSLEAICGRDGLKAKNAAAQWGARYATADFRQILDDPAIDLVIVCTRHDLHGQMTLEALQAGKNVLVEKPLCIIEEELDAIRAFYKDGQKNKPLLSVGFNRRFSPFAVELKKLLAGRASPLLMRYCMNAGRLPDNHWTHGPQGGGRIVGEACHIIDFVRFLTGSPVTDASAASLSPRTDAYKSDDNKIMLLEYDDGSAASLEYFSTGSPKLCKERIEVHFDGKSALVENFQKIVGFGVAPARLAFPAPVKGQYEMLLELGKTLNGENDAWPIDLDEIIETTRISLALR